MSDLALTVIHIIVHDWNHIQKKTCESSASFVQDLQFFLQFGHVLQLSFHTDRWWVLIVNIYIQVYGSYSLSLYIWFYQTYKWETSLTEQNNYWYWYCYRASWSLRGVVSLVCVLYQLQSLIQPCRTVSAGTLVTVYYSSGNRLCSVLCGLLLILQHSDCQWG